MHQGLVLVSYAKYKLARSIFRIAEIFKDPLTTAAAIDRVVHHSIIIEFGRDIQSMRMEEAQRNQALPPEVGIG